MNADILQRFAVSPLGKRLGAEYENVLMADDEMQGWLHLNEAEWDNWNGTDEHPALALAVWDELQSDKHRYNIGMASCGSPVEERYYLACTNPGTCWQAPTRTEALIRAYLECEQATLKEEGKL